MTPQLYRSAMVLALLGVCLQVAVASLGGRLCFRTSSDAGPCCFDACCEDDADGEDERHGLLASIFDFGLGGCPAGSDCCIDQPATPLIHNGGANAQIPAPTIIAWLAPDQITSQSAAAPLIALRPVVLPQPPPEMRPIRATVLLI